MSLATRLRKLAFGISPEEATFARRGFQATDPRVQCHLEQIGRTFVQGYLVALEVTGPEALSRRLDEVPRELRGFAYEGAAMGLALLDFVTPWKGNRWQAFLAGPGDAHAYMVHVGAGWAAARLPWVRRNMQRRLPRLDPLLCWLVVDGYGFHEGFFHWPRYAQGQPAPRRLSGYARRVFDQGLGRSLWFVRGADVEQIAATIRVFPPQRHGDLFSGLGLACAYAGGVDRASIEALGSVAGSCRPELAQGVAFGAKARRRAGNPTPHTELACQVLCAMPVDAAAAITDQTLADLPPGGTEPAYELWRRRIQARIAARQIHGPEVVDQRESDYNELSSDSGA